MSKAMSKAISSLIASGTKLWLDSIDPKLTISNRAMGVSGATSNPIIVADLIRSGAFDKALNDFSMNATHTDALTWTLTDHMVTLAEGVFREVFDKTKGDDGYVSFELDPLLEDSLCTWTLSEKAERYVSLATQWSQGHENRMIKVPATPAGILALEGIAARGIPLNVTLIFSERQYTAARDAVWKGAQKAKSLDKFKSVYSIFVSRIDVYADRHYPDLTATKEGLVGTLNAKRLWKMNQEFWSKHPTPLKQEIIFASTGTKKPNDAPWKYVSALAGSDIQTNPPGTNDAVANSSLTFTKNISDFGNIKIAQECFELIDWNKMEADLMAEGLEKFSQPQKDLLKLVASRYPNLKS